MAAYQTFSTTADVGIQISGNSIPDLFREAVNGFNQLVMGAEFNLPAILISHPFEYRGDSYENILVNLLNEMLYLCFHSNRIAFEMELDTLTPTHLRCNMKLAENPHYPLLEIKSVTYHRLNIVKKKALFSTSIIFDI